MRRGIMRVVVEMELFLRLCFFLLFSIGAPAREVPLTSCSSQIEATRNLQNASGISLPLHHPRSPCVEKLNTQAAAQHDLPFSDILHHDTGRVNSLLHRLAGSAASVPLTPGTALGVGNYVVHISLGTPPNPYAVVIDTGSSLSWLQCLPCKISCHNQLGPIFNPAASSTYRSISCSAAACSALSSATLNPSSCSRSGACIYEATYGDSSFSLGYLSEDTLSLSKQSGAAVVPGFVFGCGEDNEGLFGKSAGIVGLAKNSLSLLSQLAPRYGNSFSYCLPSPSATGYISFGGYNSNNLAFTPMASSSLDKTLYFLKLEGITVAGRGLAVSSEVYDRTPTIIDSGTVITRLPDEVYSALSGAVVAAVGGKLKRAAAFSLLDTCYEGSTAEINPVPEVAFVFASGAVVRLPARNVMIDVEKGTTCLAFAAERGVAIIGNRQQQTFNVVYDVGNRKIGFAAGGCG
ncbi:Aspartic proteinase CDR1 [Platanthera zijinensis]|uniref:Aspartic proteinase CDR1 n=1 Tax=Platanthera zijinensis TaxID=2320716 RepID=A0AAP0BD43_9ASPA